MKFVVTGTGRSGTGFIVDVLRNCGLRVGHEAYFGLGAGFRDSTTDHTLQSRLLVEVRRWIRRLDGDASWMAVPRLSAFDGAVLHQVRHPLKVISSFAGMRFFSTSSSYLDFASQHFDVTGDDLMDSIRWWTQWNEAAETHAHLTYRLEDLGPDLLQDLLIQMGFPKTRRLAADAISRASGPINTASSKGFRPLDVSWSSLPSCRETRHLLDLADHYGYSPRIRA